MILAAGSASALATAADSHRVAVRVEDISKGFALRRAWLDVLRHPRDRRFIPAVDHVSFTAFEGEILGFLGANGAGKSTLLKMLATLVIPDSGRAEVMGFDVAAQPEQVRRVLVPVAPDERSLDWRLSAYENLRFFGALQGLRGTALRQRIAEVLAGVELQDVGQKLVGAFSSGMRQRLLIARALLSRPRILLLDEPTRSLDPLAARSFRTFLREEIAGSQGCTVLLATHDADEALGLCDRVTVLHRGRLLATGSPAELARSLANERFRLWTSTPDHFGLTRWLDRGAPKHTRAPDEPGGVAVVDFDLPAEMDSAELLSRLVMAGVHVARFEKVPVSLAELMERVVARTEGARA